eukprot:gene8477-10071_t
MSYAGHDVPLMTRIPAVVHFTYPTSSTPSWPELVQKNIGTWRNLNGKHKIIVWDDAAALSFVKEFFPEFVDLYNSFQPIEKTNLFRYLVLYKLGGYYADTDVECLQSISSWTTNSQSLLAGSSSSQPNFIAGVEVALRSDYELAQNGLSKLQQFSQATFASSPEHSILTCVLDALRRTSNASSRGVLFRTQGDIIDTSGAGLFTRCVKAFLEERNSSFSLVQNGGQVGDLLVLGINGFGAFQHHSGSWNPPPKLNCDKSVCFDRHEAVVNGVLVRHHATGTWRLTANDTQYLGHLSSVQNSDSGFTPTAQGTAQDTYDSDSFIVQLLRYWLLIATVLACFGGGSLMKRLFGRKVTRFPMKLRVFAWLRNALVLMCIVTWLPRSRQGHDEVSALFLRAVGPTELELGEKAVLQLVWLNSGEDIWRGKSTGLKIRPTTSISPLAFHRKTSDSVTLPGEEYHTLLFVYFTKCPERTQAYQWSIVKGFMNRQYGEPSKGQTIHCIQTRLRSQALGLRGVTDGDRLHKGEERTIRAEFCNTGTRIWEPEEVGLHLLRGSDMALRKATSVPLPRAVGPGETVIFEFALAFEDACPRELSLQWRLKHIPQDDKLDPARKQKTWFGNSTASVSVHCEPPQEHAVILQVVDLPRMLDISKKLPQVQDFHPQCIHRI